MNLSDNADNLARIRWCAHIFDIFVRLTPRAKRPVRDALRSYLKEVTGKAPSESTLTTYMTKVTQGPTRSHQMAFYETELDKVIAQVPMLSESDRLYVTQLRHHMENRSGLREADYLESLRVLFGIDEHSLGNSDDVIGEYFGYRRSTPNGGLIRFYLAIEKSGAGNTLLFRNYFVRSQESWITRGFGFTVDNHLYLIGHARARHGNRSLGMRCFSLLRYPWAGGHGLRALFSPSNISIRFLLPQELR